MTKQPIVDPLSKEDRKTFRHCESVIRRGVRTFVEVGTALKRIQENQFYRETHATFEEYCKNRWEMSRAHAYRLIESAKVVEDLSPGGDTPKNESQARPLTRLRSAQARQEAWKDAKEASQSGRVTASTVEAAVERQQQLEAPEDGTDPMKLVICPDPDGIASWAWNPVTVENGIPTLRKNRLTAPTYSGPPKNSDDPEDHTVVICPDFDLFQPKTTDVILESVLEAAEQAPHWTFFIFSRMYERLFSYTYPKNIWTGAQVSLSKELVRAEAASVSGKSGTRFLYCSPLSEAFTLSVPFPFDWIVIGGSDPQPDWESVWAVTYQAADINIPILWAKSLEARPVMRPDYLAVEQG